MDIHGPYSPLICKDLWMSMEEECIEFCFILAQFCQKSNLWSDVARSGTRHNDGLTCQIASRRHRRFHFRSCNELHLVKILIFHYQ